MRWLLGLLVFSACGRLRFAESGDANAVDVRIETTDATSSDVPSNATTTVLGECAAASVTNVTTDTTLDPSSPTANIGGRPTMRVGDSPGRVSLIRFDLSALPTTSQVFSSELEISVSTFDALENGSVEIHVLLEPWAEGTDDYGVGVANWTMRDASNLWSVAGAGPSGSQGAQVIGGFTPNTVGVRHVITLDAAAVNAWIANPSTNFGMVLVGVNTTFNGGWLSTREDPDAAARPCLRVVSTN